MEIYMHSIIFKNRENDWKNALPIGNGCFGAMAFFENNTISLPTNHYEVYYNIEENVLPADMLRATPEESEPGKLHKSYRDRADRNAPREGEPFYYYRLDKDKPVSDSTASFSGSYPATGELKLILDECEPSSETSLELLIEKARIGFRRDKTEIDIIAARRDAIVTRVRGKGVRAIALEYPASRDRDYPEIRYEMIDKSHFAYNVKMMLSEEKSFSFSGILALVGAFGELSGNEIKIIECGEEFTAIFGVYTEWRYADPRCDGLFEIKKAEAELSEIHTEHEEYWDEFFSRAKISIPDKFLEKIYYVNQYALDCSSGRGGVMKHHACGLNGLWDIRHPNLWGSMWYWDVNIQAAFAGVHSSNRTELGEVFSEGLLAYVDLAKRFAKDVHGMSGIALDYPYSFYFSVWPWCAQYLFAQYEYTMDEEYLRTKAYPVFLELCRFATELFEFDERRGGFVVYPDISPEQGPLAHNTVITVASVKYLLRFTLRSAEILGDSSELLDKCRRLLDGLPEYPTVTDDWGKRFLDSEDAPANLWIRHPSMLMPVFPTGEIDIESPKELRDVAMNSIRFLEENCEIGVFQVSWLAAASARLGDGQRALRLLYEMGIDHLLRSNGLAAEENERFMNYCLIMRQPLYYPCMMEFTGEMLAAVNEMLLQSNGSAIRLFPAMPTGDDEYEKLIRHGQSLHEYAFRTEEYPAWENARFERLLARGAFEISAELHNSKMAFVSIRSNKGGKIRLTSPYPLGEIAPDYASYDAETNTLEFDTLPGEDYVFGKRSDEICADDRSVNLHRAYTKRRIFIGEDENTEYYRSIDSFVRDFYLGNVRVENHTVYKFDLGGTKTKDYRNEFFRQGFGAERMLATSTGFFRLDELAFSTKRGFGFIGDESISRVDREEPDELRRDFLEGEAPVEFLIEAPRGQYELLVASGDAKENSVTLLDCPEGRRTGGEIIPAGRYSCKLIPLVHEKDGAIRLKISTTPGNKWKLNFIFLNLYKQF